MIHSMSSRLPYHYTTPTSRFIRKNRRKLNTPSLSRPHSSYMGRWTHITNTIPSVPYHRRYQHTTKPPNMTTRPFQPPFHISTPSTVQHGAGSKLEDTDEIARRREDGQESNRGKAVRDSKGDIEIWSVGLSEAVEPYVAWKGCSDGGWDQGTGWGWGWERCASCGFSFSNIHSGHSAPRAKVKVPQ